MPALESYADLPAWAERHFPERVALAGRALRTIKSAEFEDAGLVGKAIELLGGPYWRMKKEGGKGGRCAMSSRANCARCGSRKRRASALAARGRARDDFSIEWNGRKLMLDRHLKNNTNPRPKVLLARVFHMGR